MRYLLTSLLSVLTLSLTAQVDCPNTYDGNGDGNVSINDLLDLLAVFGDSDSDGDGVWDSVDECIDTAACNYMANPSEPCAVIDYLGVCGGGCTGDGDSDGICDNEDDCVGELDECGVCNGPGPTEITIESITIIYDSVFAESIQEWLIFELTQDTTFVYLCYVIGCMDQGACNYNPEAIENDLSCEYETCAGCWDFDGGACNYDPTTQIQDDSLCEYESCAGCWDPVACNYVNDNWGNMVGLALCDYESCSGCMDPLACNYDPLAVGCIILSDQGWINGYEIEDEWILFGSQSYSECCDYSCHVIGCTNPNDCSYGPVEATYEPPWAMCSTTLQCMGCANYNNYELGGYEQGYNVSGYGPNCWFNKNAPYLPEVSPSNVGDSLVPHYYVYGYEGTDTTEAKQTDNYQNLGVLYNFAAVINGGICPSGSHVATDIDWMKLERHQGMEQEVVFDYGLRQGEVSFIDSTGYRNLSGTFVNLNNIAQYWSIDEEGTPITRTFYTDLPYMIERTIGDKELGLAVRCVKSISYNYYD
jgi:uncharacterized protein (TIGR02145 family)